MAKINIEYNERVFSGRTRICLDFTFREICKSEPDLTDTDREEIRAWAETNASLTHRSEHEYVIPLIPSDSEYAKRLDIPDCFKNFFFGCLEYARQNEKESGEIDLRLFL